jgi:hypothetical protein
MKLDSKTNSSDYSNGVIVLNCAEDTAEAQKFKNNYVVKLKGSYLFSQDRNNIYMTVRADHINDEDIMFSVVGLKDVETNQEQVAIKSLLRLPSTQIHPNSMLINRLQFFKHDKTLLSQTKSKKYENGGLVVSKKLVVRHLDTKGESPKNSQHKNSFSSRNKCSLNHEDILKFIEEEIFLVRQSQNRNLNVFQQQEYRLDLVRDIEFINENNYLQTISRFDEFESAVGKLD